MPDFKQIISTVKPDTNDKQDLRALTIETMGFFVSAIEKNQ